MTKYLSQIDNFKTSVIFTKIYDMEHAYKLYKRGDISFETCKYSINRLFNYILGYFYGSDIKHKYTVLFTDKGVYDCIKFFNNSSCSRSYCLSLLRSENDIKFKYSIKERK